MAGAGQDIVKIRPIPFSTPMVLALLDGTKTQTRRTLRTQPPAHVTRLRPYFDQPIRWIDADGTDFEIRCPYGVVGDRLWVREKIQRDDTGASFFAADLARTKADAWPWKRDFLPPMFMPWGLHRIQLEITNVRAHHVQEISEEDAFAEGVFRAAELVDGWAKLAYARLWISINGQESWDRNDMVFALTFKRIA